MWLTIQLGSREHYAVPVALYEAGRLERSVTDAWLSKSVANIVRPLAPSLAERRSDRLPDPFVASNTLGRLAFDTRLRLTKRDIWTGIMERNEWFGRWVVKQAAKSPATSVFSYSYTARLPFREAKSRDAMCVLGQIDPGPREQEVVSEAARDYLHLAPPADCVPPKYWDLWREEVALADKIVVNSSWSAKLLVEEGMPAEKLVEVPLVYERADSTCDEWRVTSDESQRKKPNPRLKALFLGSVILRKGVGQLFDAIRMLKNEPVDFTFAGPVGVKIPDEISGMSNVRFLGSVDKATCERLYRESDIFLFPTLSDGFGLTQLEALGHGLPVIASKNCGQVVEGRDNGLVLPEVSPEAIAEAIMELIRDRDLLAKLKANARVPDKCHPRHLAPALLALEKN
jgi:glycosyltransferase involved in cell wall biosynthesis